MTENKVLQNEFTWVPLHLIPNTPPRRPDNRMPLLWLARKGGRNYGELYLVNNTGETLDWVGAGGCGYVSADDDVLHISSKNTYSYEYTKILPNEAVKIDEYDGFYDLDYVLAVSLEIKSPKLGHINICSPSDKGGVKKCVLIWDTEERGKNVYLNVLSESTDANKFNLS